MNIALIKNGVIENVILADTIDDVVNIFVDYELLTLEENDSKGIGWFIEDDSWYPPKPTKDAVWNEEKLRWDTQEEIEALKNFVLPPYEPSVS